MYSSELCQTHADAVRGETADGRAVVSLANVNATWGARACRFLHGELQDCGGCNIM